MFLLVLAAMTLGSINYNNNLGFFLSFLLGSMAAVSLLHAYKNLTGLHVLSVATRPVFAGETAIFELQVRTGATPRVALTFSFPQSEIIRLDVTGDTLRRISVRIATERRGMFNPGPLCIATRYPFGLFKCMADVSLGTHCVVYPKPIPGPPAAHQGYASPQGEGEKRIQGIDDFQELQPYLSGEPIQHIYWKAFARGQGLQIKHFSETAGTLIMLDWNTVKGLHIEQKLSRLCDFVLQAYRFNLKYGLNLPGKTIFPGSGDTHRQVCLRALALFGIPPTKS